MGILLNILISAAVGIAVTIGAYNYLPLSFIEKFGPKAEPRLGAVLTTIQGTDTLKDSRTTINNNFTALNNYKIENSSSSIAAITTLSNLVSVGTLTTGTWNASTLAVGYGGTGSTTLAANLVLLGNGTNQVAVVNGTGALGQFLTSQGAATAPIWTTSAINEAGTYNWTGAHTFTTATTSIQKLSITSRFVTWNSLSYRLPEQQGAASTTLKNDGTGELMWAPEGWARVASTSLSAATGTSTSGNIPSRRAYRIHIYIPARLNGVPTLRVNANGEERYGVGLGLNNAAITPSANQAGCFLDTTDDTTAMAWWIDVWSPAPQTFAFNGQGTELASGAGAANLLEMACQFNATSSPITSFELRQTSVGSNLPIGTTMSVWASED